MPPFTWSADDAARLAAIQDDLAQVSVATASQLLINQGWRNTYMQGLQPLQGLGLGRRLVGRARTCQYLMRRGPELPHDPAARRVSPEIVLIEELAPGDIICIDALGLPTAGIIGDILSARILARGALAAIVNGAVRDSPYIRQVGLPVFTAAVHPAHSGRELVAVDYDQPINMAGVQVLPGDVILADDEGAVALPLDLAEMIAADGPKKERLEAWIRERVVEGGSIHDYYPPSPAITEQYEREAAAAPAGQQGNDQ